MFNLYPFEVYHYFASIAALRDNKICLQRFTALGIIQANEIARQRCIFDFTSFAMKKNKKN
jgi:hypothetical protein